MSERLPWPGWAARYYWGIRSQSVSLEQTVAWLLKHGVKAQNVTRLEYYLPRLEATARSINLYCLDLEQQRGSDRWPRWAVYALVTSGQQSDLAVNKLVQARRYLEHGHWVLMEKRLNDCLLCTQKIRRALLEGPPPEVNEDDREWLLRQVAEIVDHVTEDWT